MRILSVIFYILAGLLAAAGLFFYVWIVAMACAFHTNPRSCTTPWPWDLNWDDFQLMVLPALCAVLICLGIAVLFGRAARRRRVATN